MKRAPTLRHHLTYTSEGADRLAGVFTSGEFPCLYDCALCLFTASQNFLAAASLASNGRDETSSPPRYAASNMQTTALWLELVIFWRASSPSLLEPDTAYFSVAWTRRMLLGGRRILS